MPSRTVVGTKRRVHITSVLAELHLLPISARIEFKIALLTFMTLTTHQPSYLRDLLQPHQPSRQLRSASHNLLDVPWMRTCFVQCSFTYSAPHIWNIIGDLNVTSCMWITAPFPRYGGLLRPPRTLCARRLSVCLLATLRKNYWTDLHAKNTPDLSMHTEKNWLNYGSHSPSDHDPGVFWRILQHCEIGHFLTICLYTSP